VLGWPKICQLAHAFLWECGDKGLKLAQHLGQLGVFLTLVGRSQGAGRSTPLAPPGCLRSLTAAWT
jgi:hypothetical protein